jgi:hypothetical protein
MTRLALKLHPQSPNRPIGQIEADVRLDGSDVFSVRYEVAGDIAAASIPSALAPARTDGLWRQTCFEAFVAPDAGGAYFEFNFSPSTQWAAYGFAAYREGMSAALECPPPEIKWEKSGALFVMRVTLDLGWIEARPPWRIGLSAIIVDANGEKSYWALAHPDAKPDFHHPDCFVHSLTKD